MLREKLMTLGPEITLMVGACACLITGLSSHRFLRNQCTRWIALTSCILSAFILYFGPEQQHDILAVEWVTLGKTMVLLLGAAVVAMLHGVPNRLRQVVLAEKGVFNPEKDFRGETFALLMFTIAGVSLCLSAGDIMWLILALELASLPTYVLVATTRDSAQAPEAAIKYFFSGALATAVFILGFTLIYGATGCTSFIDIRQWLVVTNGIHNPMMLFGVALAVIGIGFKCALVPMHSYAPDVYQGASSAITAAISTLPKFAGFAALTHVLLCVGWLPGYSDSIAKPIAILIAVMAVASMLIGNAIGLSSRNIKRVLGGSSIAQGGYLCLPLIAGPMITDASLQGWHALLIYLALYTLGTLTILGILGSLVDENGSGAQTYDDIRGLRQRHPLLALAMAIGAMSLLGLPFLGGFVGKFAIAITTLNGPFTPTWNILLVVALLVNSGISAAYYLRIASNVFLGEPTRPMHDLKASKRRTTALISAFLLVFLGTLFADAFVNYIAEHNILAFISL